MTRPPPEWLRRLAADEAAGRLAGGAPRRPPPETRGSRHGAVLILFGDGPDGVDVLLIERAATLRSHAGQPAFPGGATDPGDSSAAATALREAEEETGLDPAGVTVLAVLAELYLPPSAFRVTPVLGWWHTPSEVAPVDAGEVAAVARVPLTELAAPANRVRVAGPRGYVGPGFRVRGLVVWGFTAGVLQHLLTLAGQLPPIVGTLPVIPASPRVHA